MSDLRPVLLLSGTPASGKDTITNHLVSGVIDSCGWAFSQFKKDKLVHDVVSAAHDDRNACYNLVDSNAFSQKVRSGDYIQYHTRYSNGYGVSKAQLEALWKQHLIPIIHNGKQENLLPFWQADFSCFHALLLCAESETWSRLRSRQPDQAAEWEKRLSAYWEERAELATYLSQGQTLAAHMCIATDQVNAADAADWIQHAAIKSWFGRSAPPL